MRTLERGDYYFHQIEGSEVITRNGEKVGFVQDLWPIAENDLLVVRSEGREYLIPFTHTIILEIDVENKTVIIDPPDGLLDLNEI